MADSRRSHHRVPIALTVYVYQPDRPTVVATTRDLSLAGAFVVTDTPPPFGSLVELEIALPALDDPAILEGTVRWVGGDGFGVQFRPLRARHVWAMNRLLHAAPRHDATRERGASPRRKRRPSWGAAG